MINYDVLLSTQIGFYEIFPNDRWMPLLLEKL